MILFVRKSQSEIFHPNRRILVRVSTQELQLWEGDQLLRSYVVSTSRFGLGTTEGSFRTPLGRFRVCEKIGGQAPLWSEFRSRKPTGRRANPGGEEDGVLSRILWLDGCEPENANTRDRYIYIHGTNREDLLGQPASHGCIRMANADIAELFDLVSEGAEVRIEA